MQAMVSNPAYAKCLRLGSLEFEDYKSLGELSFVQLAELRHRGAFSTVSQTFTACCIASSGAQNKDVRGLVDGWYSVRPPLELCHGAELSLGDSRMYRSQSERSD